MWSTKLADLKKPILEIVLCKTDIYVRRKQKQINSIIRSNALKLFTVNEFKKFKEPTLNVKVLIV